MESTAEIPETSLWANRKCLLICAIVAIANMQYGLDSAAIGSLQAMPGFLEVFGYKDPTQPSGYAIEASSLYFNDSLPRYLFIIITNMFRVPSND